MNEITKWDLGEQLSPTFLLKFEIPTSSEYQEFKVKDKIKKNCKKMKRYVSGMAEKGCSRSACLE